MMSNEQHAFVSLFYFYLCDENVQHPNERGLFALISIKKKQKKNYKTFTKQKDIQY